MNRLFALMFAVAFAAAAHAVENPVYAMFPDNLIFLLTFDDGTCQPEVGAVAASAKPPKNPTHETAEGGVFGRALSAGRIEFGRDMDGKNILDVSASGTVVCWVRYMDPVPKGKNPGITFFQVSLDNTPERSYGRLLMMKQSSIDWMNAFYEYVTDKRRTVAANTGCSYATWKPGVWKMCVMTWTQDKIGFSHDGAPIYEQAYSEKLGTAWRFMLTAPDIRSDYRGYQIDELAILDRKLTDAEIKSLYDKTRQAAKLP